MFWPFPPLPAVPAGPVPPWPPRVVAGLPLSPATPSSGDPCPGEAKGQSTAAVIPKIIPVFTQPTSPNRKSAPSLPNFMAMRIVAQGESMQVIFFNDLRKYNTPTKPRRLSKPARRCREARSKANTCCSRTLTSSKKTCTPLRYSPHKHSSPLDRRREISPAEILTHAHRSGHNTPYHSRLRFCILRFSSTLLSP